jgi:hypothetical protein
MKKTEIATILRYLAYKRSSGSERLSKVFEENDSYKVSYRLISNFLAGWNDFELKHFPTEEETVRMAKLVDPYFVRLFKDKEELAAFKRLYEFHKDTWKPEQKRELKLE